MSMRRSHLFWFVIGGLFLILAGVFAFAGVTYPYALPILLVAAGAILIVASLLRFRITLPAIAVFLAGIVVLGLVLSGYSSFPISGKAGTETHERTTAEGTVDEIDLTCLVSTGSIGLSFTTNASLIYRIVFTKYYFFFTSPTVAFNDSLVNRKLTVNAESSTVSVDIVLSQTVRSSFNLTTSTGSVRVEVPPTAFNVRDMRLKTSTGEVWANITNTANLRNVVAATGTGRVEAFITSSSLNHDCNVLLSTSTGQVVLDLQLIGVQSDVTASTSVGRVNTNLSGFTVLDQTSTTLHARTMDYLPFTRKLNVAASTSTGNVDITADYST